MASDNRKPGLVVALPAYSGATRFQQDNAAENAAYDAYVSQRRAADTLGAKAGAGPLAYFTHTIDQADAPRLAAQQKIMDLANGGAPAASAAATQAAAPAQRGPSPAEQMMSSVSAPTAKGGIPENSFLGQLLQAKPDLTIAQAQALQGYDHGPTKPMSARDMIGAKLASYEDMKLQNTIATLEAQNPADKDERIKSAYDQWTTAYQKLFAPNALPSYQGAPE